MTDFATAFRTVRLRLGLSQSRIAEHVDCDHSYVSRLENGVRLPTREFIDQVIAALDLPRADADHLLIAGGYLPSRSRVITVDPLVADLAAAIDDPALPDILREALRRQIHDITRTAHAARQSIAQKGAAR